jgi:allantoinase
MILRARRVITPTGIRAADVHINGEMIADVRPYASTGNGDVTEIADDCVLLPGLVDSHVHVNEPGRTEWEGFATATAAAAAGGVTTIVDMPLNSIPATVDVGALATKQAAALGKLSVDVGFWGGAVPGNSSALKALHDKGVVGFKCFLAPSGVPEFGHLDRAGLRTAMAEIAGFKGLLIAHAEDPEVLDTAPVVAGRSYAGFVASRPESAENAAIAMLIETMRDTGCRAHIVHLSSAQALSQIAAAKADGLPLTVETCPHYLHLAAEDIPDGATQFKCCPPIRAAANRDRLWDALGDSTIDLVVSDHSPSTVALKNLDTGDFGTAWGGIASVQIGLSAVWTQASQRGYSLIDIARWMSQRPAQLTGLSRKGAIAAGMDADFAVFAPDRNFTVEASALKHRNPITPYTGSRMTGVVTQTWLRGELVGPLRGRMLTRAG